WRTFAEGAGDALASAPGRRGICPPPGSDEFRPGLNRGDWCVRLTLSDGGPNDGDGQTNGVVLDPGGVGAMSTVVVTTSGKGGGGAFDWLTLLVGAMWLLFRRGAQIMRRAMFAGLALAAGAAAQADDRWYVGIEAGPADGEVSESDVNARLADAG